MKPGHVNFFDGMRVSAEHMDHLQGSLHSALADLRGVAGAGRVHEGLEVVANEDGTLTVQPGLAFDFERRRIVCEEPRHVAPTFEEDVATLYVCIEYASDSSGVVEEVPTLIWDGCRVVTRPDLPGPEANQVTLAEVRPGSDGGPVAVTLIRRGGGASDNDSIDGSSAAPDTEGSDADSGAHPGTTRRPRARQGIARLRRLSPGLPLRSLAQRIADAPGSDAPGAAAATAIDISLGSELVPLDFAWRDVRCHGVVRIGWEPVEGGLLSDSVNGTVHGEATSDSNRMGQAGLWRPSGRMSREAAPIPALFADSLVRVPLGHVGPSGDVGSTPIDGLLEQAEVRLSVGSDAEVGLEFRLDMRWKGDTDEAALRALTESARILAWDLELLWKASG